VYLGTRSGGESPTPLNGTVLIPGGTYMVRGLPSGTYYFTVEAVNATGNSIPSNEVKVSLTAPPALLDIPIPPP
jgi:predicted phage tail protein